MTATPYTPELAKRLRLAARAADAALLVELARQFGPRAVDLRHVTHKHDAATRAAYLRFIAADAVYTALLMAGELRYFGPTRKTEPGTPTVQNDEVAA